MKAIFTNRAEPIREGRAHRFRVVRAGEVVRFELSLETGEVTADVLLSAQEARGLAIRLFEADGLTPETFSLKWPAPASERKK